MLCYLKQMFIYVLNIYAHTHLHVKQDESYFLQGMVHDNNFHETLQL